MIYLVIFVLGLCLGSFVNALVWRLQEQTKTKSKKKLKELSVVGGRSLCPSCKHQLAYLDLIPVISWLSLGGKCRYCKKKISVQYPVVELLSGLLFVLSFIFWPQTLVGSTQGYVLFGVWLVTVTIGIALSVYDIKWQLLPNKLLTPLLLSSAVFCVVYILLSNVQMWQVILATMASGGIFYVLYQISDGKWIGGGDVKLGLILGLLLIKPENALIMLFVSSLLGCLYALFLLIIGKYKKGIRIPFGPFLLIATYIVVLFSEQMISFYEHLLI